MAAMSVSRRALSHPSLLQKLRLIAAAPAAPFRSLNTNALRDDEYDDEADVHFDRRSDRAVSGRRRADPPRLFGEAFGPFFPTRSLSRVLNLMADNPFVASSRGFGGGMRRDFDAKEDNEGLYLRLDMPGLGKEHVKLSVEQDTLIIWGEVAKAAGESEESVRRYSSRIDLPPKTYEVGEIKAEMKNGVLKVMVPKLKEEEQSDVVHVKID